MKIFKGIVKKVPTEEHFELYEEGNIEMSELRLADTIIKKKTEQGEFEMLPIRLSYQELDRNGNEKFIFDEGAGVYVKSYKQTPILYATGKEMRILLELGEYAPVKVVAGTSTRDERIFYNIECIQNQHCGLEMKIEDCELD